MGFPGGSDSKESACNAVNPNSVPRLGRSPGGEHGNPLQDSCLENSHRQRSLAGYSPWSLKEQDMMGATKHSTYLYRYRYRFTDFGYKIMEDHCREKEGKDRRK